MKQKSLYEVMRETGMAQVFEEEGEARGELIGKANDIITVLRTRYGSVPKSVQASIRSYSDLTALDSLLINATTCTSINEFRQDLIR